MILDGEDEQDTKSNGETGDESASGDDKQSQPGAEMRSP